MLRRDFFRCFVTSLIVILIALFPLLLSVYPFADDVYRSYWPASVDWTDLNARPLIGWIFQAMSLNQAIINLHPLTLILSIGILALASATLCAVLQKRPTILGGLAASLLAIFPYCLANWSYHFDCLPHALAMFLSITPFFIWKYRPKYFLPSLLLITVIVPMLYQPAINVAIIVALAVCAQLIYQHNLKTALQFLLKTAIVMLVGGSIYLLLITLFFPASGIYYDAISQPMTWKTFLMNFHNSIFMMSINHLGDWLSIFMILSMLFFIYIALKFKRYLYLIVLPLMYLAAYGVLFLISHTEPLVNTPYLAYGTFFAAATLLVLELLNDKLDKVIASVIITGFIFSCLILSHLYSRVLLMDNDYVQQHINNLVTIMINTPLDCKKACFVYVYGDEDNTAMYSNYLGRYQHHQLLPKAIADLIHYQKGWQKDRFDYYLPSNIFLRYPSLEQLEQTTNREILVDNVIYRVETATDGDRNGFIIHIFHN